MTQLEKSDGPPDVFEIDEMVRTAGSLRYFVKKQVERDCGGAGAVGDAGA